MSANVDKGANIMAIPLTYEEIAKQPCQKWLIENDINDQDYYEAVQEMEKHRQDIVAVVIEVKKGIVLRGNFIRWLRTVIGSKQPIPTFIYGDIKNRWVQMALGMIAKLKVVTLADNYEHLEELLSKRFATK